MLQVKHRHYEVLVRWNNHKDVMVSLYIQNWIWVVSSVESAAASCTCKAPYGQSTQHIKKTKHNSKTIQNGRTFFEPLTHVSMWCNVNGLWLLSLCNLVYVEKANALVPVQKHLLIYLFGWNYIVDWSLFLVFERDKQNICYHTSYPYHLHNRKFDRRSISRVAHD